MDADLAAELPPDRSGQEAPLTPLLAGLLALDELSVERLRSELSGVRFEFVGPEPILPSKFRRAVVHVPPEAWPRVVAQYRRPNRQRAAPTEIVVGLPDGLVTLREMTA